MINSILADKLQSSRRNNAFRQILGTLYMYVHKYPVCVFTRDETRFDICLTFDSMRFRIASAASSQLAGSSRATRRTYPMFHLRFPDFWFPGGNASSFPDAQLQVIKRLPRTREYNFNA